MKHPLALIVYRRPEETREIIARLRIQKPDPVYVFSDAPAKGVGLAEVAAVRAAVQEIDWTKPHLVFRNYHYGLKASIVGAVDYVLSKHKTVIVLEDDCLPGPYFMDFTKECLGRYERKREVISIGAYTPPLPAKALRGWLWGVYFVPRIETWGWATWRDRWVLYQRNIRVAYRTAMRLGVDLAQCGKDIPRYVEDAITGKDTWSPGWLLASYIYKKLCVYPTESHIQYVGRDGKGEHCGTGRKTQGPARWRTKYFPRKPRLNPDIEAFIKRYYG